MLNADTVPLTRTVYSFNQAIEVKSQKLAVGGPGSPLRVSPSVLGSLPDALFSMSQGQAPGRVIECSRTGSPETGSGYLGWVGMDGMKPRGEAGTEEIGQ